MRLLLTRHPEQAGDLEAALTGARLGGEPLEVGFLPLTDFVLPRDGEPLRRMTRELAAPDAAGVLVVTSPNTVRALRRHGLVGVGPEVRAAVTGPGTARLLAAAAPGVPIWAPESDRSAEGILAGLTGPARVPALVAGLTSAGSAGEDGPAGEQGTPAAGRRPVAWLPQSDRARPLLADGLRAAGWEVRTAVAYRTVSYPAPGERRLLEDPEEAGPDGAGTGGAVTRGAVTAGVEPIGAAAPGAGDVVAPRALETEAAGTAVLLTSSSAAEEFAAASLAPLAGERVRLLAIGRPTARTAAALGLPLAAVCPSPDAAGVLAALRDVTA